MIKENILILLILFLCKAFFIKLLNEVSGELEINVPVICTTEELKEI